ncbi:DCG1-like protein [Fusarium heterosporum]|uniref:DCG1-like protein n=1 Tax=Fusarium heterosporum TaxID=42747 RepID=A0A8H5SZJ9_FUSHE|nr:DCG1-like protein [Fusarium heterosporum]
MSELRFLRRNLRILVLNPNSSSTMTDGMANAIRQMSLPDSQKSVEIYTYTAPPHSAPDSINDQDDISRSTQAVLDDPKIEEELDSDKYDAVLVACFSVHTLVSKLTRYRHLSVIGIFEASILTSYSFMSAPDNAGKWGIVTTGKFWEEHLSDGVKSLLGQEKGGVNSKFAGVFSSGLTAGDFHTVPPEQVREKLVEATKRLLNEGQVSVVVMGCGGMAGLENIIRSTAIEMYGKADGNLVYIVDGVKSGVMQLEQMVRSKRIFR